MCWRPQLEYWKQQLAGALTGPPLRGDLPGMPGPTSKGGLVPMALPTDLVRSLRSLAAACGATLFVVVLAAWKARAPSSCSSAAQRRHIRATALERSIHVQGMSQHRCGEGVTSQAVALSAIACAPCANPAILQELLEESIMRLLACSHMTATVSAHLLMLM